MNARRFHSITSSARASRVGNDQVRFSHPIADMRVDIDLGREGPHPDIRSFELGSSRLGFCQRLGERAHTFAKELRERAERTVLQGPDHNWVP